MTIKRSSLNLGSTSYVTTAEGNVSQYIAYMPFGDVFYEQHSSSEQMPYKFNAKELDEETSLYYYGARYYDPSISLWLSVDPLAEHPNQVDKSPYAFSWNNPVRYVDPDGQCPDCPAETYLDLADQSYAINEGDITEGGWKALRVDENIETSYRGVLYEGEYEGETEYIYATAGTTMSSWKDWTNNAKQLWGGSDQYRQSVEIAEDLFNMKEYEGISFTGHSLGGGLASANALSTGGKAVTFNAAGLSASTKKELGLNQKANIQALVVNGDFLDYVQRRTPGMTRAEGEIIMMPRVYFDRARNHMMGAMKTSFQKYKKQLIEQYKNRSR